MEINPAWSVTHLFHTSLYRKENQLSTCFIVWHKNKRIIFGRSNVQYVFLTKAKKFTIEEVKNLVCNTTSSSCWANHSVKFFLLFFNSDLKPFCEKGVAGYNPLQWRYTILIHQVALQTGAIFNSIARKILPKYWSYKFSFKKALAWKSHLRRKWGTKFQIGPAFYLVNFINLQVVGVSPSHGLPLPRSPPPPLTKRNPVKLWKMSMPHVPAN